MSGENDTMMVMKMNPCHSLVIIACEVGEKVNKPDIVRVQCRGVFEFLRLLPSVPFLLQVNTFKDNPSIYDLCASVFSNPQAYVM